MENILDLVILEVYHNKLTFVLSENIEILLREVYSRP